MNPAIGPGVSGGNSQATCLSSLGISTALEMMGDAEAITVFPYRNADKIGVTAKALKAAIAAGAAHG